MSNHHLEFSQVMPNLREEEEAWLKEQLTVVYVFENREYSEAELPEELDKTQAAWYGPRAFRELEEYTLDHDGRCGFDYSFEDGDNLGERAWDRCLWIYTEEWGEPEFVAHLVQKFLKRFRPDTCWELSYAVTCSKPQIGEFGGGAIFVTADGFEHMNELQFLDHARNAFKETTKQAITEEPYEK